MAENSEHDRLCPFCGGKTIYMHVIFNRERLKPRSIPASWAHICGKCNFMGYLTGDLEYDKQAVNLYTALFED